jgi:exopolysaccharide production protein ExoY
VTSTYWVNTKTPAAKTAGTLCCRLESVTAVLALVMLAPLMVGIALVILGLSRRNPLVRHQRVGWRGAPLAMLKFRTMWGGAESDFVPSMKCGGDPRVTSRFAAFCRRYSLDELPQLYHVARGDMSLVGPRPITRRELNEYYGLSAEEVVSVRPGLTGLWQVNGRNRLSYARRRRLDLFLVRHASAGLYFRILQRSFSRVLSGRDAY